ncbi:hypothetical protein F4780DRAFT_745510 [Xylariomycetidae sp. FL0641]|nr:hypothetical protein F4780DRAFT_745510 [Xylariomycetidae sp. FL0641]
MSESPYQYGQSSGKQPYAPFPPSQVLPNAPSSQFRSNPMNPANLPGNFASVNNSYDFNANRIPGLGFGVPSSLPPAPYFAPSAMANITPWQSQPPVSQTPLQPLQQPEQQTRVTMEQESQKNISLSDKTKTAPGRSGTGSALEEGELSEEGEFEDLYEPKVLHEAAVPTPEQLTRTSSSIAHPLGSAGDADGSSIYDARSPQDDAMINSTVASMPDAEPDYSLNEDHEATQPERERSGSYSPYLSPREIQRRASVTKVPQNAKGPAPHYPKEPNGKAAVSETQPSSQLPFANGTMHLDHDGSNIQGLGAKLPPQSASISSPPFSSIAEGRKKAQEAILGMWPLKVRYADYIEEGVNADVMKSLFKDLGLDTSAPKAATAPTAAPSSPKSASQPQGAPVSTASVSTPARDSQGTKDRPTAAEQLPSPVTAKDPIDAERTGEGKASAKSAAEERKERIARKLAAKAQKNPQAPLGRSALSPPSIVPDSSAPSQPGPSSNPSPPATTTGNGNTVPSASPAKTKRAENNALLQQKLAALKQAQAAKQLQAARNAPDKPTDALQDPKAKNTEPVPLSNPTKHGHGPEIANHSINSNQGLPTRPAASGEAKDSKNDSIPGLSLSTESVQGPNRNLKRPVASDFDNYPPLGATLKRYRTQETLIIDVSDDEDVEMEIGSPADEPSSPIEGVAQSSRRTPLAAFPPLSDHTAWRQRSSPASSTAAAPEKQSAKIDLLHKKIDEAKRRIAEAEAKKAAKASNSPQPQTPEAMKSARLPKVAEAKAQMSKPNAGRRDRIASYELPLVDAALKQKQDRLKQVLAEAARIELEVQTSINERQMLTRELETLVSTPQSVAETNEQPSAESGSQNLHSDSGRDLASADDAVPINRGIETVFSAVSSRQGTEAQPDGTPANSTIPAQPTTPVSRSNPSAIALQHDVHGHTNGSVEPNIVPRRSDSETVPAVPSEEHEAQDEAMEIDEPDAELSQSDQDSYEPTPAQISDARDLQTTEAADSEVGEIIDQPNPMHVTGKPAEPDVEEPSGEGEQQKTHDADDPLSYQSPLGYFRAYRFHPKFFDEVAGGLKSMTYSSRIDPMRPLCPRVLAGEQCPDGGNCEFQHFDSMVLPDAEIITQLGSADMFVGETRTRFIEGLKRVLNELKANKVKDFDRITKAIVKHRQDFLEDKSKVLHLDSGASQETP